MASASYGVGYSLNSLRPHPARPRRRCRRCKLLHAPHLHALVMQPCCVLLLQCAQAVHVSAAAQLAEAGKPPAAAAAAASSTAGGDGAAAVRPAATAAQQGASESVVFGAIGRAAAEARDRGGSGVPAITKFLGFSGPLWPGPPACAFSAYSSETGRPDLHLALPGSLCRRLRATRAGWQGLLRMRLIFVVPGLDGPLSGSLWLGPSRRRAPLLGLLTSRRPAPAAGPDRRPHGALRPRRTLQDVLRPASTQPAGCHCQRVHRAAQLDSTAAHPALLPRRCSRSCLRAPPPPHPTPATQMLANPGLLQVGYGATILSFLGGVHWGLAMTNVGGEEAPCLAAGTGLDGGAEKSRRAAAHRHQNGGPFQLPEALVGVCTARALHAGSPPA